MESQSLIEKIVRPGGPGRLQGMLSLAQLQTEVSEKAIETVVAAFTDMQGRLIGKRIQAEYFLEEVVDGGVEGCDYLLALDMEMVPVDGYEIANWDHGYGDFGIRPDMETLRRIPWLDGTALVLCDVVNGHGKPYPVSPRQILLKQYERATAMGLVPMCAGELEFFLFKESYAEAHEKSYNGLTPTIPYTLDYHVLATTFDEPFIADVRRGMEGAGIPVEFSKGEAAPGQHEINLRYADAVTTADRQIIYKNGVKEIAQQHGISATFMAKPSAENAGSSGHVHLSLVDAADGESAFWVDGDETILFRHFLGGLCAHTEDLALFLAPTVNSYKRFASNSWAPTTIAWGRDNRTCGFRIVGHGEARRVECRIPGADMNPYLAIAGLLAAGLDGIENQIEPPAELKGNAYAPGEARRFPSALDEAVRRWEHSAFVRKAFGEAVWSHYLNYGRTESRLFNEAVTDYERARMFERG